MGVGNKTVAGKSPLLGATCGVVFASSEAGSNVPVAGSSVMLMI